MSKWWCHLFRWSSLLEKSHRKAGKLAFQTKKLFRIPVSNVSRSLPIHSGTGGGPIFPLFHRSKGGQGAQQFLALLVPRDPVAQPCPTKSMPRFTSLLTWSCRVQSILSLVCSVVCIRLAPWRGPFHCNAPGTSHVSASRRILQCCAHAHLSSQWH